MTKVTYNMYSCNTCCISREMIEMDGRDGATCRKSKLKDIDVIFGMLMIIGQNMHSIISYLKSQKEKTWERQWGCWKWNFSFSRERETHFSLDLRLIRPSEFFGARRKVILRGEAYVWTPICGISTNSKR